MRARWVAGILVLIAVGVGSFFGGRASVSNTPSGVTAHPLKVSAGFQPISATFISPEWGWTLGVEPCAGARQCLTLGETTDAGLSWKAETLPAPLLRDADRVVGGLPEVLSEFSALNVRFANHEDGWLYGSLQVPTKPSGSEVFQAVLWTTHDGGNTWRRQPLNWVGSQGTVFDVEADDGTVYLMAPSKAFDVTVMSSPVGEDRWRVVNTVRLGEPAGGGPSTGSFVLNGSRGWLVEGNDRGTSGSARLSRAGTWVAWTPPCSSVGHSFSVPAAPTPKDLVAVCTMGGFAYPLSRAAPRGATLGSDWIYFSDNDGTSFTSGTELPTSSVYDYGVLASPAQGTILLSRYTRSSQVLIASFDAGTHWSVVYRGQLTFIEFTTGTQGVGLVRSTSGHTSMVMTHDGGRHWSAVRFGVEVIL